MKTIDINKLRAGDILVCKGSSTLSKTILKSTKGVYSHTAQVIELNNKLYIIDAQEGGFIPRTFEYWRHTFDYDFRVFRNPTPTMNAIDISNWFMQFSGVPYDKKGLAVGLGKSIMKNSWFKFLLSDEKMAEHYRNNGMFWCSESSVKLYVNDSEQYTPQKVYEWLLEKKWIEII